MHGKQPGAGRAGVSLDLASQERRHSPPANIVQVFHEAVIVSMDIALLNQEQIRAGELVALITEIDLQFGKLFAQAFFVDATAAARPAADAPRLAWIEHPAAQVAVHAARGHPLAPHGHGT